MTQLFQTVLSLSGWPAYLLIGLLAAGESAAFLGLVLPGEAALLLGGVLASQGRVSLPVMLVVAVLAAVVGDSIGYEVGRRGGPALRRSRLGRLVGEKRWTEGQRFLVRWGGPAVLLGRWVGLLRALVPSLAGMGNMPYRKFLLWNAAGGTLWATVVVLLGYTAGAQYGRVAHLFGQGSALLGGVAVVVLVVVLIVRYQHTHGSRFIPWHLVHLLRQRFTVRPLSRARRLDPTQAVSQTLIRGGAVALVAGIAFAGVLGSVIGGAGLATWDQPVLRFLALHRSSDATSLARAVTLLGSAAVAVPITLGLAVLWWRRSRRSGVLLVVAVLGSGAITGAVKLLTGRDRPTLPLAIDGAEHGFAFPSGHSLTAMTLYGTLSYLAVQHLRPRPHRTWVVAGLLLTAMAVALTRLYLGYHWLSDVLGSWTLALLWLSTVITADRVVALRARGAAGSSVAPLVTGFAK